ncbi:CueP family metal-binding protein [Brachybacterium vulturis]|uniref:CueP family metal-binding protein n=1 Tax=Brachybacterium vulturis TaxID=2017484 RepID=UPI001FEB7E8C|nr:CueP family metal-binding protein [Brachybacterium vulturis]
MPDTVETDPPPRLEDPAVLIPHPAPAVPRRALFGGLVLSTLAVAGCGADREPAAPAAPAQDLLSAHGLAGRTSREIIDLLEALPLEERPTDLLASVMPDRVDLSDAAGREASIPLPEGEAYVSVAPFVDATHECFFHSLTTCLGELQQQSLEVHLTTTDGEVLLDQSLTTAPNGFLGLWLPRDQQFTLTLTHDGASASTPLATDSEAPTCLTTMQLGA